MDDDVQPDGAATERIDLADAIAARKGSDNMDQKVRLFRLQSRVSTGAHALLLRVSQASSGQSASPQEPGSPMLVPLPDFSKTVHPSHQVVEEVALPPPVLSSPVQDAPAHQAAAAAEVTPNPAVTTAPSDAVVTVQFTPTVALGSSGTATASTMDTTAQREGEPSISEPELRNQSPSISEKTTAKDGAASRDQPFCVMCGRSCGGPDSSCAIM